MNGKGVEFLNNRLEQDGDYSLVILPSEVRKQLKLDCSNINSENEDFIYDKVEELLHIAIIKLGYNQDLEDYKWKLEQDSLNSIGRKMTIKEIKDFIQLAKSKINEKEGEEKKRQQSFVLGLEFMFNMMQEVDTKN